MNEEQKNIETCLAEDILSEVANVPTDPQFRSLVEESFDPLQQQALRQAGYNGYEKVVWTHKPYTFTSQVKQMKSNIILLLRRLWRFPFGRGTTASSDAGSSAASNTAPIRSLADMWQHYITRLKGNPEYGIPSRLSQLTDLPDAPALLADRDMSSGIRFGENPLPDGMSLAQLLCTSAYSSVTEIVDTNVGWTMTNALPKFQNLKKLYLGCGSVIGLFSIVSDTTTEEVTILAKHVEAGSGSYPPSFFTGSALKKINAPYMETFYIPGNDSGFVRGCGNLEEINAPMLRDIVSGYINTAFLCLSQPQLRRLVLGTITGGQAIMCGDSGKGVRPKLIHLELGEGTNVSLSSLQYWNPSYVLSDNPTGTDLIEEGSTATNNLKQFLSNFRDYIAERLTDKGSGLTLTLSQEVRNAIHAAEDEYGIENIIITQKGWTISPAPK